MVHEAARTGRGPGGGPDAPAGTEPHEYGIRPPGYRLPDATRPGRMRLQVADLGRSLAFYEGVLGFRRLDRLTGNSTGRVTIGPHGEERTAHGEEPTARGEEATAHGEEETALVELHERPGARPLPEYGRLGLYHFALLLPDRPALGRFVTHLERSGVRAGMSDHGVSEAVYLRDPDGLGIEVYADRPRSAWRRRGRELVMVTAPLDVAGLVAAAGGERWSGLPPGTAVGHVHLHVGDLRDAAAFYHGALGFDLVVWSYPGALFLSAGGYHHHLGLNTWAAGAPRPREEDARLLDWEVVVPADSDADETVASLEAAGYEVGRTDRAWRAADPWGTVMRLVTAGDP